MLDLLRFFGFTSATADKKKTELVSFIEHEQGYDVSDDECEKMELDSSVSSRTTKTTVCDSCSAGRCFDQNDALTPISRLFTNECSITTFPPTFTDTNFFFSRPLTTFQRFFHDILTTFTPPPPLDHRIRTGYGSSTCGYCSPVGQRSQSRSSRSFGSESPQSRR